MAILLDEDGLFGVAIFSVGELPIFEGNYGVFENLPSRR
jgi:hypothetical protein